MMKANRVIGMTAAGVGFTVCLGLSMGWASAPTAAVGLGQGAMLASAALPALQDGEKQEGPAFKGNASCRMCHLPHDRSWKTIKKAKAMETLKPGVAVEAKEKHGLDPNKDYTRDTSCLPCHTTGFGHPGGYELPDESDAKVVREAKRMENVGCESCHGPGEAYLALHEEIFRSKRKYKVEEMYAAGMWKIEASTCTTCHNEKSPTYDPANPFNFEERVKTAGHDRIPLKQREE